MACRCAPPIWACTRVPPEFEGPAGADADAYVDACVADLPALQAEGLVDAVDAFCETIGFTPAQVERLFQRARQLGLPVKLHAEQLSDQGGSQLTARFGGLSADHLEWLSPEGVAEMAEAGTVAMLLPGAYHCLRETKLPPIAALREAGVAMALSTDHNPGTSPLAFDAGGAATGLHPFPHDARGSLARPDRERRPRPGSA